eukprot:TRINITY_DN151_c0_g2_i10.p1 TRINITY_DN151_c0_g2~~TRINITY_DN151_c0_g2_i10.p1  ORF type:complete len:803 (+),score=170.53 TRINITY_DN151_c0_g2_i10:10665-13073(+)
MTGRKWRRFASLRRSARQAPRTVQRVVFLLSVTALLLTVWQLAVPLVAGGRVAKTLVEEEKVPAPEVPFDGPAPRDVRLLDEGADGIDAAQPLVDDHGVDHLSVVPVDAVDVRVSLPPISVVVLFHFEYDTLNHTLHTWMKNDLVSHVAELVFFLNGMNSKEPFLERLPLLEHAPWSAVTRVEPNADNLKLGLAIRRMVQLASHDYVLLLEKDWALIEHPSEVAHQLSIGVSLLNSSVAHVVRYRHRTHAGAPLHARIMHENREQQMLDQQTNLYCYIHHWVKDPTEQYAQFFTRCEGTQHGDDVWCSTAKYCQWTNNPSLFKRNWFLQELADRFAEDYKNTMRTNANSNMLDFEFYTNWNSTIWNDREFVVALPFGLFEHQEVGEQNLMNTVWYAWNRLHTDAEEKKRELLRVAREECELANKSMRSGATFAQRYPIEFVRMYHYEEAMTKNSTEAVQEVEKEAQRVRQQLEDGHGSWRNGVTDLTNFYYTIALYTYPMEPTDMKIAFVGMLFKTEDDDGAFEQQVEALTAHVNALRSYVVVVYCDESTSKTLTEALKHRLAWNEEQMRRVVWVVEEVHELVQRVLGAENYERVQRLYAAERWQRLYRMRSGGRLKSLYSVLLDVSRPLILGDCLRRGDAQLLNVSHFVWFDARANCSGEQQLLSGVDDALLRANVMLNCVVTGVRATSLHELEAALFESGFEGDALLREMRKSLTEGVRMVDLNAFGGGRLCVRLMSAYYDVALRDALRRGMLGNGREMMSVAVDNVDYHFNFVQRAADHVRAGGCAARVWRSECDAHVT